MYIINAIINPMSSLKKLALIAGDGNLPQEVAKSAKEEGYSIFGIAITEEAKSKLENTCETVKRFSPGQISKILETVKKENINQVIFIGKIPKLDLLKNIYKLDWLALKLMSKLKNLNDDSIHFALIDFLKTHDLEILPQSRFLKNLFVEKEILSKRKPTLEERIDIEYGLDIAKKAGSLDIGQTVIVKNKMILAIEAIEGTDEAIKRGCKLANGEIVIVKVTRPNQDERFDLPTIGENTLLTLANNGGGILAFEAGKTIVTNKEKMIEIADKHNICLLAI